MTSQIKTVLLLALLSAIIIGNNFVNISFSIAISSFDCRCLLLQA